MDKAIFLDVDGVLNCNTSKSRCGYYFGIDKDKVKRLATIIQTTNALVVLSSDWRHGWDHYNENCEPHGKYLNNHLWKKGGVRIDDRTPDINWNRRGLEIVTWLDKHPEIKQWVVLDDTCFSDFYSYPQIKDHWIWTDDDKGLTDTDVQEAIRILS